MKIRWYGNTFRRSEFKVGIMVIAAVVLLSVLLIRASHWRFSPGGQEIRIRFSYVGGLLENAPVHMYGMEVGKVASIILVEDGAEVTVRLYEKAIIREGYHIRIDILGLVGEKYVEIINGPSGNPPTTDDPLKGTNPISVGYVMLKADEITDKTLKTIDFIQSFINTNEKEIHASVTELKTFIVEARNTLKKTKDNIDVLLARVDELAECAEGEAIQTASSVRNFAEELNKDREEISSLIKGMTDDLNQLVTRTTPIIEQSLNNLQEASEELPDSMAEIKKNVDELGRSTSQFMAKLEGVTTNSGEKLQKGLDDFGKSAAALGGTVDKIDKLVAKIGSGQGTLGKLITDDSSHEQLNETMAAGKNAVEEVGSVARRLDNKLRLIDTISTKKGYELSYNNLSRSLQNQFTLSSTRPNLYFYSAGLSVRGGRLFYNLQVGRKLGYLTARAGSIRSKAGIGLDYWPFAERIGVSLEGLDITDRSPEVDLNVAVRLFGGWYFIFGAEDLAGSDVGLSFGVRTEVGQ